MRKLLLLICVISLCFASCVGGASDGGMGTWDLAAVHGDLFAAAMPLSCGGARNVNIPVYWHTTSSEGDKSEIVNRMNANGCNIRYWYYPDCRHGGDQSALTLEHLADFFSNVKNGVR